jgi:hypothetical protein
MTTANPPAGPGWLHEIKYDGFRMPNAPVFAPSEAR